MKLKLKAFVVAAAEGCHRGGTGGSNRCACSLGPRQSERCITKGLLFVHVVFTLYGKQNFHYIMFIPRMRSLLFVLWEFLKILLNLPHLLLSN